MVVASYCQYRSIHLLPKSAYIVYYVQVQQKDIHEQYITKCLGQCKLVARTVCQMIRRQTSYTEHGGGRSSRQQD